MPSTSAASVLWSRCGGVWLLHRTQTQWFTFFQGSASPNPAATIACLCDYWYQRWFSPLSLRGSVSISVMLSTDTVLITEQCSALDLFNEVTMAARKVRGEMLYGCKSQELDRPGLTPVGLKHFTPTGDLSLSSFPGNTASVRAGGGAEPPEHTALTSLNMVISKPIIFPRWLTCDISETFSKASDFESGGCSEFLGRTCAHIHTNTDQIMWCVCFRLRIIQKQRRTICSKKLYII